MHGALLCVFAESQLRDMKRKARVVVDKSKSAFGSEPFQRMIKPHSLEHASDNYSAAGPVKDGGGADQQAEAKQADVKAAAKRTNYHVGMEGSMGRHLHRADGAVLIDSVPSPPGAVPVPTHCQSHTHTPTQESSSSPGSAP